jgi:hypothetical protein
VLRCETVDAVAAWGIMAIAECHTNIPHHVVGQYTFARIGVVAGWGEANDKHRTPTEARRGIRPLLSAML